MDVEITPEPTPSERDALLRGLERLLRGGTRVPPAYASAWREAAIREAVGYAIALPRSRRGANRA